MSRVHLQEEWSGPKTDDHTLVEKWDESETVTRSSWWDIPTGGVGHIRKGGVPTGRTRRTEDFGWWSTGVY